MKLIILINIVYKKKKFFLLCYIFLKKKKGFNLPYKIYFIYFKLFM